MLNRIGRRLSYAEVQFHDRIRRLKYSGRTIKSGRGPLSTFVRDAHAPWLKIAAEPITMPGMITDEEAQYYEWVGTLYQGCGAAIELGPWLGKSTRHILRGLKKGQRFNGKQLHVFDDFIWRSSWMDQYVSDDLRCQNHANFRDVFERFVKDDRASLLVSTAKIVDYEGNERVPPIAWNEQPIEIMYIDCGRMFEVNEAWYRTFAPSFIPNITLLVMQDWGTHRERPRRPYNQTLLFTKSHPELQLIHELTGGAAATFLVTAQPGQSKIGSMLN
jgi:hypothetical protein